MFSLTIVFGPGPMVWTLMFKTLDTAQIVNEQLFKTTDQLVSLADDFGQMSVIAIGQIHGWMLEDLDQSKLAHIERALHQARTKIKGDELAQADPMIRQAMRNAQGAMPMIQPVPGVMMGSNGRFPS